MEGNSRDSLTAKMVTFSGNLEEKIKNLCLRHKSENFPFETKYQVGSISEKPNTNRRKSDKESRIKI